MGCQEIVGCFLEFMNFQNSRDGFQKFQKISKYKDQTLLQHNPFLLELLNQESNQVTLSHTTL